LSDGWPDCFYLFFSALFRIFPRFLARRAILAGKLEQRWRVHSPPACAGASAFARSYGGQVGGQAVPRPGEAGRGARGGTPFPRPSTLDPGVRALLNGRRCVSNSAYCVSCIHSRVSHIWGVRANAPLAVLAVLAVLAISGGQGEEKPAPALARPTRRRRSVWWQKQKVESKKQKAEIGAGTTRRVAEELRRRGWSEAEPTLPPSLGATADTSAQGRPEKVEMARRLPRETAMTMKWIAKRLKMGVWTHGSNCLVQKRKQNEECQ